MTFDDDFVRLQTESGTRQVTCDSLGVSWPPPDTLDVFGFKWKLVRRSQITDEQRADMSQVCRGAEYVMRVTP